MALNALLNLAFGLYDRGLLGGRPRRLKNLGEEALRLQLEEAQKQGAALDQPAYGVQYAPGEEPGVNVMPYLSETPTRREQMTKAGLLNAAHLIEVLQQDPADPIKGMIAKDLLSLVRDPKEVEKAFAGLPAGIAFPSPQMQRTEEITQSMATGRPGYGGIKGMASDYGAILQGIAPAPQPSQYTSIGGGAGVLQTQGPGAGAVVPSGITPATQMPASIQEFNLWKSQAPKDIVERAAKEGREVSYGDYQVWKWEQQSKAKVEAIAGKDPEKQLALQMAKADAAQRLDPLRGGSLDVSPDEITRMIMDLWEQYYVFLKSSGKQRPAEQEQNPFGFNPPSKK